MSIVLTATYKYETFDVEVFRDGHIEFPDYDLEYEQALMEFTLVETPLLQFRTDWNEPGLSRAIVAFPAFRDISVLVLLRLSIDYINHAFYLCDDDYKAYDAVKAVLEILLTSVKKGLAFDEIESAVKVNADHAVIIRAAVALEEKNESSTFTPSGAVTAATEWLVSAVERHHTPPLREEESSRRMLAWGASLAAEAVATDAAAAEIEDYPFVIDINTDSDTWQLAYAKEDAWQVRRFVDVMEAVGQGLPWPPMGATP